jgi:zinc D-Ala-D-Ala dipeptidase
MPNKALLALFILSVIGISCNTPNRTNSTIAKSKSDKPVSKVKRGFDKLDTLAAIEKSMLMADMVDVQHLNSDIHVDLRYASDRNFLNQNIYGGLQTAYLSDECAKKLALAQTFLSQTNPEYNLLVWDAARPVSCQQIMWDAVDFPLEERTKYVSNPKNRSLHNFGCAVDVTIIDNLGLTLDMGSEYDEFDTIAQPAFEWKCLQNGSLNLEQLDNRKLLRKTMLKAGFRQLPSEWWHYNCCSREYAKQHFSVVE